MRPVGDQPPLRRRHVSGGRRVVAPVQRHLGEEGVAPHGDAEPVGVVEVAQRRGGRRHRVVESAAAQGRHRRERLVAGHRPDRPGPLGDLPAPLHRHRGTVQVVGLDPGDAQLLKRYENWRSLDTFTVSLATDGLTRLFGVKGRTASAIRRFGMAGVQRAPFLKRFFMDEARGMSGKLPELLRG